MNRSLFLTSFVCLCLGAAVTSFGADVELSAGMELVFTVNGQSRMLTITEVDTTSDPEKAFFEGDADFDVAGGLRPNAWTEVDITGHFTGHYMKTGDQSMELEITNPAGRVLRKMEGHLEETPAEEEDVIAVLTTFDIEDDPTTTEADYVYEP